MRFEELCQQAIEATASAPSPYAVQVITSCTGLKRERAAAAEDLYLGQQHVQLMRGVHALRRSGRASVRVAIVSARWGLVAGERVLEPYERTFQGLSKARIRLAGEVLNLPRDVAAALHEPADLRFLLLGDDYLEACQLRLAKAPPGRTIVIASGRTARAMRAPPGVLFFGVGPEEARRYGAGLVALKGALAGRILAQLAS